MEALLLIIGGLWLLLLAMGGYIVSGIRGELKGMRERLHKAEAAIIWLKHDVEDLQNGHERRR